MTIYFIEMEGEGWIKIGYTAASAEKRMAQLQTGQPQKLRLIGTIPGGMNDEKSLHRELRDYRGNGEWFQSDPELLQAVLNLIEHQHPWYFARGPRLAREKRDRMEKDWSEAFAPTRSLDQTSFDASFDLTSGTGNEAREKNLRALGVKIRAKTGAFPPWVLREISKINVSAAAKYVSYWSNLRVTAN